MAGSGQIGSLSKLTQVFEACQYLPATKQEMIHSQCSVLCNVRIRYCNMYVRILDSIKVTTCGSLDKKKKNTSLLQPSGRISKLWKITLFQTYIIYKWATFMHFAYHCISMLSSRRVRRFSCEWGRGHATKKLCQVRKKYLQQWKSEVHACASGAA